MANKFKVMASNAKEPDGKCIPKSMRKSVESACGKKKAVKASDSECKYRIDIFKKDNPDALVKREFKMFKSEDEAKKYGESIANGNIVNVMKVNAGCTKKSVKSGKVLFPWAMVGRFADGYTCEVSGDSEADCIEKLGNMQDKHGELEYYSGVDDDDYDADGRRIYSSRTKRFGVKASKAAKKRVAAAKGYWADDINAESYRKILKALDDYLIANYDGKTIGDVEIGVSELRNIKDGKGSKIEVEFYSPDYEKDTKLEIISAPDLRSKFLCRVSVDPFKFDEEIEIPQSGSKQIVVDKINEIANRLSGSAVESSCKTKKTVKASAAAKKRKAIKASDNYYDEDIVFYFNGKRQFEGSIFDLAGNVEILCHDPKVMQVFQDYCNQFGDPFDFDGTPRDTALVFTKLVMFEAEEANEPSDFYIEYSDYRKPGSFEIYYANDGIYSAKSIKCAVASTPGYGRPLSKYTERQVLDAMRVLGYKLWGPTSSKGKVEFYNPTYAPGSVTTFLSWAEVEDYLDDIVENGISDRAYSYEEQDYMPELIEGILAGRTDSSTDIKCDWDGSSNKRFNVTALYEYNRGVSEWINTDDWSTVEEKSHTWLMQGYYVQITDSQTGESIIIDPDEYAENFDGEFAVTEEIAEFRDEVWKSMGIGASKSIKCSDADGIADEWEDIREIANQGSYEYDGYDDGDIVEYVDQYFNRFNDVWLYADYVDYNGPDDWSVSASLGSDSVGSDFNYFLEEHYPELYNTLNETRYTEPDDPADRIAYDLLDVITPNDFFIEFYPNNNQWSAPQIDIDTNDKQLKAQLEEARSAYEANRIESYKAIQDGLGEFLANGITASTDIKAGITVGEDSRFDFSNPIYELDDYVKAIADGVVNQIQGITYDISKETIAFFDEDNNVVFVQPIGGIIPEPDDLETDIYELSSAIKSEMDSAYGRENWEQDEDDPDYASRAVELSTDVKAADETVDIDDLEYVTGDEDDEPAEDWGFGFDSNGDPIDESIVDELERIAQEVLDKSEIHNIDEYADLHNFNYYASIPYIQESFDISFTYVADIYELSKNGMATDEGYYTTVAPYNIHFNVRCKNGEVEYAECTDVDVNDGYVKDVELKNFNLDALVQFATDLVNPVAADIYNATTNI